MRNVSRASVFVLTGPMASGKTTVARRLAARFALGVHLEGDVFRRSIISGRAEMTPDLEPAAVEQLRLRYRITAGAAQRYAADGFTVALDDVVAGPLLMEFVGYFTHRPLFVVALVPSPDALAARDAGRTATGYRDWGAADFYRGFIRDTPRIGLWLDTSDQTPDETVESILSRTSDAAI